MVGCIHPVCVCFFRLDDRRSVRERLVEATECFRTLKNCETANRDMETADYNVDIWKIERTDRGKPYFPNQPKLHFSISHSGDYWACAMANQPIGLDLQEHVTRKGETLEVAAARYCRMAQRFFHPREAEYVKQEDSYLRFFQIWAARESYVKYTGQGIDDHFGEFCVLPGRNGLQEAQEQKKGVQETGGQAANDRKAVTSWYALDAWFQEMKFAENYTLCMCTQNVVSLDVRKCYP